MSETQNEYETEHKTDAEPTPGPWRAFEGKLKATEVYQIFVQPDWAEEEYSDIICEMPRTSRPNDEQEANARLIAAAGTAAQEAEEMGYDPQKAVEALPELLEALEFARGGASRSGYNLPEHTKEKLRSVLASAEGSD
jgi:hypothetical protein